MKIVLAVVVILVILGCGAGCSFVSRRNDMVTMQEAIKSSWSQVDIALQRRADLGQDDVQAGDQRIGGP